MHSIAENFWLLTYPLKIGGMDVRRNVSIVRLRSTEIAILSSGPFTPEEVNAIHAHGQPRWLVDAMLRHDTYSREGWAAFPGITFLAPPGFEKNVEFPVTPILPSPVEWGDELLAIELQGVPSMRETVFFHPATRTLIVQDLVFNFPHDQPFLKEVLLRLAVGKHHAPGMPRTFPLAVQSRVAFQASLAQMLAWDFDRVIVGHGNVIESHGKDAVRIALSEGGFEV